MRAPFDHSPKPAPAALLLAAGLMAAGLPAAASTGSEAKPHDDFVLPAELLAMEGDVEWGEYLAAECRTCHRSGADAEEIPSISGWPVQAFMVVMHAYRQKQRPNPVMQLIAGRLSDEEIAALAAYYAEATETD